MATTRQKKSKDLKVVQEHYEDYPYPLRNPEDERTSIQIVEGEFLGQLNHWLYSGRQDFKQNFRILIAGGGTGDASTFLGEQLKNTNAEIVYIDFSKASLDIAQKRAEIRNLKNINFIHDSILNIPNLALGKFDYINCSGMLHHLASPVEGLKILKDCLSETGGMHIMIYAKYGRTGVYHIQELMKIINKGIEQRSKEVANARIIINSLPNTNWFKRAEDLISDHINYGDVGIYDLFLHKQDRAYSIPEMHEYISSANLNFVQFSEAASRILMRIENHIQDPNMLEQLKASDIISQQAICELIVGNIIKHTFYVTNSNEPSASLDDLNNIPYFYSVQNVPQQLFNALEQNTVADSKTISFKLDTPFCKNINMTLPISTNSKYIFQQLIEGNKSLKEIFDGVRSSSLNKIANNTLLQETKALLSPMIDSGILLLRNKKVAADVYLRAK